MDTLAKKDESTTWLGGEGGPLHVLQVAWPLILSTGLFSITIFVDRMLLFKYSDQAAAGAMGAGTMFWAMTCVPVGVFGYTSTFVAQYVGVKRMDRAMTSVVQGIFLALSTAPAIFVAAWLCPYFFASIHDPRLVEPETAYFRWIAPGAFATIVTAPLVGLFAGTNRTLILLGVDLVVTILNAVLDCLLIFGYLGFPELGVAGAAIATSLSMLVKLIFLLLAARRLTWNHREGSSPRIHLYSIPWRIDLPMTLRVLRFGWPAGISTLAEAITFSVIMMIVGHLGERPMAATTLALGVNMIAFIPMMGLGMSVGVLVGQYLTGNRLALAERSVRSGMLIAIIYSTSFAILYGVFPVQVLAVYQGGVDPMRFQEMQELVVPILWFIAVYCIFDAIQIVFVGALKGAGDTTYVLLGNVISGLVTITCGKLLGMWLGQDGLYWWWGVMTAWVLVMAIVFSSRYFHGGWKTKRVIEPELL